MATPISTEAANVIASKLRGFPAEVLVGVGITPSPLSTIQPLTLRQIVVPTFLPVTWSGHGASCHAGQRLPCLEFQILSAGRASHSPLGGKYQPDARRGAEG